MVRAAECDTGSARIVTVLVVWSCQLLLLIVVVFERCFLAGQINVLMFNAPPVTKAQSPQLLLAFLNVEIGSNGEATRWLDGMSGRHCNFSGMSLPSVFNDTGSFMLCSWHLKECLVLFSLAIILATVVALS